MLVIPGPELPPVLGIGDALDEGYSLLWPQQGASPA